jgi:dihydroneopterin aldolase
VTDRITLTGLRVRGRHGVFEHERRDGQDFLLDATVWLDLGRAARSDDLNDTLHYGELAEMAAAVIAGPPYNLIEALAGKIADEVMSDERVQAVDITIHKPSAPIPLTFADVSVTVHRSRRAQPTDSAAAAEVDAAADAGDSVPISVPIDQEPRGE